MWAHPGKQMLFMGGELGQEREWNHDRDLDWWLLEQDDHRGLQSMIRDLNALYQAYPALWEADFSADGFAWIDASDVDRSVLSFVRRRPPAADDQTTSAPTWPATPPVGAETVVCVANLTPVPHEAYRVGLPQAGRWREILNTDAKEWGGSGLGNGGWVHAQEQPWHGQPASASFVLPPLGVLWLTPDPD
jgi:1,4-alpha-glucan branching enzyme